LDPPKSDLIMLPFEALDGIALSSNVGLDLSPKLVWNTTAGTPHGPGVGGLGSAQCMKEKGLQGRGWGSITGPGSWPQAPASSVLGEALCVSIWGKAKVMRSGLGSAYEERT
jgi:hypothetical protein